MWTVKGLIEKYIKCVVGSEHYSNFSNKTLYEIFTEILRAQEEKLAEKDKLIASAESRIESAYENILIEKDKEIIDLKQQIGMAYNFNQNLDREIDELKSKQLYKEYFYEYPYSMGWIG